MNTLPYLQGYPESLLSQVTALIEQDRLGEVLQKRYPQGHDVNSDKALYQYTQDLEGPLSARSGADQQSDVRQ